MDSQGNLQQGRSEQRTDAAVVKPLQPVIRRTSVSNLTGAEITRRLSDCTNAVDINLLKPDTSNWLRRLLKELNSENAETSFFALYRFKEGFNAMIMAKGPAQSAGFAAYALEQGILDEVKRLLKAAQVDGDFYLFPKLEGISIAPLSKLEVCFKALHTLTMDARCVRFVLKAIPDLLALLEGAYFSAPVSAEGRVRGLENTIPPYRCSELKKVVLLVVLALCFWSKHSKVALSNRNDFVQQILRDCLSETTFAKDVIERVVQIFVSLAHDCNISYVLEDIAEVAFNALELTHNLESLAARAQIFAVLLLVDERDGYPTRFRDLLLRPRLQARKETYKVQLVALTTMPSFPQILKRPLYTILGILHPPFRTALPYSKAAALNPREEAELEKLLLSSPKAVARRQELIDRAGKASSSVQQPAACTSEPSRCPEERQSDPSLGAEKRVSTTYWYPEELPDKSPCRKCSRSDCSNAESALWRFKVCSGCRLAVYCSPECQKIAWKQGHKTRCKDQGTKKQTAFKQSS